MEHFKARETRMNLRILKILPLFFWNLLRVEQLPWVSGLTQKSVEACESVFALCVCVFGSVCESGCVCVFGCVSVVS